MKLLSASIITALLLPATLHAQQVQKCCGTSNSTFLLGNLTYARHTQSLYLPGDLTNAQNGNIDRLYFRYGSTGEDLGVTLYDVMIRMAQTTATAFSGGNQFFTALDTVLMVPELTIAPGATGEWFSFPLGTPFPYAADRTLILDIWYADSTTPTFGTYGTANNGRKLYAIDLSLPTGTTTSGTWQDLGFDIGAPTAITEEQNAQLFLRPLPGYGQWHLVWIGGSLDNAVVQLSDASGRLLHSARAVSGDSYQLDMERYGAGVYIVQVRSADGTVRTQRFLKP